MKASHKVLLIECEDRPGIVAAVAGFIRDHDGNLVHSDQHTDPESNRFYMRLEWQPLDGDGIPEKTVRELEVLASSFGMRWQMHDSRSRTRVALLVSKQDHCAWDLLLRQRAGELHCDVAVMVSNHDDLRPVAEQFGVPFAHIAVTRDNKSQAEAQLLEVLEGHRVELVVLARYMQILSGKVTGAYRDRVINVHHSFLPAFIGAKPYHQAHQRGVKLIGATAHYATEELDQGPIIEQVVGRTSHRDTVADLIRKGRDLEKLALAHAARMHCEHRILVTGNKTVIFG